MTAAASRRPLREASWAERGSTFTIFLTMGMMTGAWAAALPALKLKLDLSTLDLSIALTALTGGSVLATILAGIIAPRFGTGRATGFGAVAIILGLILPPLAQSLPQFAAASFLLGAGVGSLDVSVNGHAGFIEQRWGGPIMSSFHGAFSVGGLAGAALGGAVAGAGWGVGAQLWGPAALVALLNLTALPFLGRGPRSSPKGLGLAWPERAMLGICAIVLLCFIIEGGMADWSAVYLSSITGASIGAAATGYAAFSVTMAIGRLTGDRIIHRFGARHIVIGGGALAALGLGLAVAFPQTLVASLSFALVGIGAANIVPVGFSAATRMGSSPTAGVAVVATVGYAGFLSGPPLIGGVASLVGLRGGIACLAIAAAVVSLVGIVAMPAGRQRR